MDNWWGLDNSDELEDEEEQDEEEGVSVTDECDPILSLDTDPN